MQSSVRSDLVINANRNVKPDEMHNKVISVVAALIRDNGGRVLLVRKRGTSAFMQPGGKRECR